MGLSRAQKQILDKFNVSRDLQDWLAQEFNQQGEPKLPEAPDFLMVISDHLQAAEIYLASQRIKLNKIQNPNRDSKTSTEEWQTLLNSYEEVVKEAWLRATGYWRIADEVISKPDDYGVKLQRKHIDYAFQKKNLPLVEMLKWSKPEFFIIPSPPLIQSLWAGFWAGMGGLFAGMWGGLVWARKISRRTSVWLRPIAWVIYSLRGILTGMMMGCIKGARLGFQIAKIKPAIKVAYYAAIYNPFVESMRSKQKQYIDIKVEEILFRLSEQAEKKGLQDLQQQRLQKSLSKQVERAEKIQTAVQADQTTQKAIEVRFAKAEEMGLVLNLIKESAAENKMLSEVLATEDILRNALLGPEAKAKAVLGFFEDKPIACIIFFHHFNSILASSGIFIETFYIQKSHRNTNLIQELLSFLAELALKQDCRSIEWLVSNQNSILREFLQEHEAKPMKDWVIYRIEGEGIEELAGGLVR